MELSGKAPSMGEDLAKREERVTIRLVFLPRNTTVEAKSTAGGEPEHAMSLSNGEGAKNPIERIFPLNYNRSIAPASCRSAAFTAPSSSGLGHRPFKA